MKSSYPIPGDPWPPDMTMTVEDRPTTVNEMLWVREAFALNVTGDAPPPLIDTPAPASRPLTDAERDHWTTAWPGLWSEVVDHAGRLHDREAMDRLMHRDTPPDERETLLHRLSGPSWRDEFGDEVFDDPSYRAWDARSFEAVRSAHPRSLEAQPERRAVSELASAWGRGLVKVVVLACEGTHVRTLPPQGLLVTAGDRAEDASYREALASFRPR